MAKIGSARINELGKVLGGAPGDNNGREVAEEEFYFHKLTWLAFQPKSKEHAKALAQSMRDAVNNDKVGYTQELEDKKGNDYRLGVYAWVREGKKIRNIDVPTGADCSGLVRGCILEATGVNLANFNTASEPKVLEKSGLFEKPFKVESVHQLQTGMILVTASKGHTAIVTEANEPTGAAKNEKPKTETAGAKLQASRYRDTKLSGTYKAISKTSLRYAAGKSQLSIMDIPAGARVTCYGFYNEVDNEKWLYVSYAGRTGYIYALDFKRGA